MGNIAAREAALAIAPKITGGLSFIGSAGIALQVLTSREKRQKTFHRLVATLSFCDMISSFCFFLSTWPIPQGANLGWDRPEHYGAAGNAATCTAQGFGIQLGVTTAFLNLMLSIHYLLVIRYNCTEQSIQKKEPYMIGIALLLGIALSIPGLPMQIYQNTNMWCWLAPNWDLCAQQGLTNDQCYSQIVQYRWALFFGPLWATIGLILAAQIGLVWTVRQLEVKASRWRATEAKAVRMRQSRQVALQATWYMLVFVITWLPYTIIDMTGLYLTPNEDLGFALLLIVVICTPIQGCLNVLVYHRHPLARASIRASTFVRRSSTRMLQSHHFNFGDGVERSSNVLASTRNNKTCSAVSAGGEPAVLEDPNPKSSSFHTLPFDQSPGFGLSSNTGFSNFALDEEGREVDCDALPPQPSPLELHEGEDNLDDAAEEQGLTLVDLEKIYDLYERTS